MSALYFWLAIALLLCVVGGLIVIILTYPLRYFDQIDLSQIHAQELQIPVGDIELQ